MRRLHSRCPQDLTFKDQTGARNCPNPGKTFRISQSLGRARRRALPTQTPPGPAKRRPGKHHDAHGRCPVARPFPGRNAAVPPHTHPTPARPPAFLPIGTRKGLGRDSVLRPRRPDRPVSRDRFPSHGPGWSGASPPDRPSAGPGPRRSGKRARPAPAALGEPPPPLPPSSCLLL